MNVGTVTNPTPEDIVEAWVSRGLIVDEYGGGSAEAKLWLIDNPEVHQWALDNALLSDIGTDWNESILRLQVEYKDDFDLYSNYGDSTSDDYIANDAQRAEARQRLLFNVEGNLTNFGKAYYTRQASGEGYSESNWPAYVEYSQLPTWGSWRERFLLDNLDFYKEYVDKSIGNHPLIDTSKIRPVARDNIYRQFENEFAEWDDTGGMNSKQIESMRARLDDVERGGLTFKEARYMVDAYDKGVASKYVSLYADYYQLPDAGYEQEWFMMAHPDYYKDVWQGVLGNQEMDFSKVPTREVWNLYQTYLTLPSGSPRYDFRAKHPELDDWLVRTKGYTPVGDRGDAGAPSTPWEELSQVRQFQSTF